MITEEKQVLNRWRKYFNLLLNPNSSQIEEQAEERLTESLIEQEELPIDRPMKKEIRRTIRKLKNNKTLGIDNMPGEA